MNNLIPFGAPESTDEMEAKATDVLTDAKEHMIINRDTYEAGAEIVRVAKQFQDEVHRVWDPVCNQANAAHKAATKARKEQLSPFVEAEKIVKRKLDEWDREQQRKAEEERRKREAEARRRAEEAQRKAEEAERNGDAEAAEEALAQAIQAEEIPVAPAETEKAPEGVSYIDNWQAEIVDPEAVPREYMVPDVARLTKLAKANNGKNPPAGVRFVNKRTTRII